MTTFIEIQSIMAEKNLALKEVIISPTREQPSIIVFSDGSIYEVSRLCVGLLYNKYGLITTVRK